MSVFQLFWDKSCFPDEHGTSWLQGWIHEPGGALGVLPSLHPPSPLTSLFNGRRLRRRCPRHRRRPPGSPRSARTCKSVSARNRRSRGRAARGRAARAGGRASRGTWRPYPRASLAAGRTLTLPAPLAALFPSLSPADAPYAAWQCPRQRPTTWKSIVPSFWSPKKWAKARKREAKR